MRIQRDGQTKVSVSDSRIGRAQFSFAPQKTDIDEFMTGEEAKAWKRMSASRKERFLQRAQRLLPPSDTGPASPETAANRPVAVNSHATLDNSTPVNGSAVVFGSEAASGSLSVPVKRTPQKSGQRSETVRFEEKKQKTREWAAASESAQKSSDTAAEGMTVSSVSSVYAGTKENSSHADTTSIRRMSSDAASADSQVAAAGANTAASGGASIAADAAKTVAKKVSKSIQATIQNVLIHVCFFF